MQGDQARSGAEIITLGEITVAPDVEEVAGPNIARTDSMAVVLPNGEVAHFGGATTAVEFSDATAILDTGKLFFVVQFFVIVSPFNRSWHAPLLFFYS